LKIKKHSFKKSMTSITPQPQIPTEVKAGALTTLAAIGSYNKFTVCDPKIVSFATRHFERHTNFAVAFHAVIVNHIPTPTEFWQDKKLVTFSFAKHRNADLIGPTFLHCYWGAIQSTQVAQQVAYANELGNAVVSKARFIVGTVKVEETNGEALHCLKEFGIRGPSLDESQMLGSFAVASTVASEPTGVPAPMRVYSSMNRHTYTPLNFHFCQERAEYFPLVGVQNNDPVIEIELRAKQDLFTAVDTTAGPPKTLLSPLQIVTNFNDGLFTGGELLSMEIAYSGIYLDNAERQERAQRPYSYVFKYVRGPITIPVVANQKQAIVKADWENASSSYFWFYRRSSALTSQSYFDFSTRQPYASIPSNLTGSDLYTPLNPFAAATIRVNNHVRVKADGMYFYQVAPYVAKQNRLPTEPSFISSFHFDMNASEWNVDFGSQNDSRIDNLIFEFLFENTSSDGSGNPTNDGIAEAGEIQLYAQKFSVAKIAAGQFGLMYSTV